MIALLAFVAALTPAPSPSCATPEAEAQVISAPAALPYPQSARALDVGPVSVLVEVRVEADGSVGSAAIYKSSGNVAIDSVAYRAAKAATYSPKIVRCQPVAADYLFRAEFNPGTAPSSSPMPQKAFAFRV